MLVIFFPFVGILPLVGFEQTQGNLALLLVQVVCLRALAVR